MQKKGLIFVVSGPSGSGKTTLAKKILEDSLLKKKLSRLVSFTTRPRRPGERNRHDYFFVSRAEFLRQRREKKFLEWTEYLGYYYATAKDNIRQKLSKGRSVVLCVDQRGAFRIRTIFPKHTRLIFILPPDLKTLEKRIHLRSLKAKNHEEIARRLRLAREEMKLCRRFDCCIMNKSLTRALNELKRFVRKEIVANQ
ncbi:MAG: guanylate kinase [Candidatus Omnitrophica bacterium]|nr:guanylate kinase [Candidatus Omnitrophota bacterium]MDD5236363.1 guanylate kinase [Candidatus Omnitrophota bacterium]MDD5610702.1 guanylate kinase [Candidatus Omnitrophota bacterium]